MCLDYLNPIKAVRGYGFKTVNSTEVPDEFVGRWPYFSIDSGGCLSDKKTHRNCVVWKLGRMYRVKHKRITRTERMGTRYPAGVHLYRYFDKAFNTNRVTLVCYYTSGLYQDQEQVVAMRCTPLLALRTRSQKEIFKGLIKSYGVKRAIEVFKKRYAD